MKYPSILGRRKGL